MQCDVTKRRRMARPGLRAFRGSPLPRLAGVLVWLSLALAAQASEPDATDPAGQAPSAASTGEGGALANPAATYELPTIEVISTTPLAGIGVTLEHIPSNVQTLNARQLDGHGYDTLSDALNGALGSVNVNDTQGNPYQMDVNVRGFTASPVLGTPQGVSVFVDGARVNETFGDVVNWDLIPQNAIANITLMPGANPQFGLNTLGGALSVVTKSGFQFPGTRIDLDAGSARRRQLQFESGGHGDSLDYFVAANLYRDDGWGDHNPSAVRQVFAKTGFQDDDTDVDLALTVANTHLVGNQTIPLSYLDNFHQVYTYPDTVDNRMAMLNLKASQYFGKDLLLGGSLYYRRLDTTVFNSNANGNYNAIVDAGGTPVCAGLLPSLPDCPNAQNILNAINQHSYGAALQVSDTHTLGHHDNTAILGLSLDRGRTAFTQGQQDAVAAVDRGTFSTAPLVPGVALSGGTDYTGLYATDTLSLRPDIVGTVSGRYNRARVRNVYDYYNPDVYPVPPAGGDYTYTRFNPAAGLNYAPDKTFTAYTSYSEGMRAPTPVELSCSDPNIPCALPNAFSSDPYLKMVVSRTLELGARGSLGEGFRWTAAVFQTRLQDDILFVATSPVAGYFTNVGDTQRRGLELGLAQTKGAWTWNAHYTYLDATFQTPFEELVSANSAANALTGLVQVPRGSTLPGIPRHQLKLQLRYAEGQSWSVGAGMVAQSQVFARGDENNADVNGTIPAYAVFSVEGRYHATDRLELNAHVGNVFDRRYSSYGALATNFFNQPGHTFDTTGNGAPEQFRSIGSPRLAWVGMTWWFDRPSAAAAGVDRD